MSKIKTILIASVLFSTGCGIYLTCRQNIIGLNIFKGQKWLEYIKIDLRYNGNPFVYFFLFCFSDMLWYLALLLIQSVIYDPKMLLSKILFYCAVLLPFVLEFLQLFHLIPGTYDSFDLLVYCFTLSIFIIIKKKSL